MHQTHAVCGNILSMKHCHLSHISMTLNKQTNNNSNAYYNLYKVIIKQLASFNGSTLLNGTL